MRCDRKLISALVLLFLLFLTAANPVFSETSKEKDIRRLLKVSGILEELT